jgi:beta-lactam-binding protein with PASTA domain
LKASKHRLRAAGCNIGTVRKRRNATAMTGKVVRQSPKPDVVLAPGASVEVTLGERI